MFTIKTFNKISKLGLDRLPKSSFLLSDSAEDPDAILVRSASLKALSLNPNLKAIGRAGAGVNNIPIDRCTEANIVVFNTPGANANAVKELVLGSMLMASRHLLEGIAYTRTLVGKSDEDIHHLVEENKAKFKGFELRGKKLGVVGLGAIGLMVANEASSIGMEVEGYDPFISVHRAWELSRAVRPAISFNKLLSTVDFLTLHMSLTEDTKSLLNRESLAKMKKGAVVLNFARAEIVDEAAMIEALNADGLSLYITDFPTERLLAHPKVICIPHLGASTKEAEDNCAVMIADQIHDFLVNGNIVNSVNFPNCSIERSGDSRIVIANKNVPNMVGQITSILAAANLNILEMVNKSRGDLAYNILDLGGGMSDDVITQLRQVEGITMVRVLNQS